MNVRRARSGALFLLPGLILAGCGDRSARPPQAAAVDTDVSAAVHLCDSGEQLPARTQVCFQRRLLVTSEPTTDTATELPLIDVAVKRAGGFAESCHIVMHWLAATTRLDHHVTLASLQSYLPRTNDPVLGRVRTRARLGARAGNPQARSGLGRPRLCGIADSLSGVQLRSRARPRIHARVQRGAADRAADVRPATARRRRRLRARRLPRLLVLAEWRGRDGATRPVARTASAMRTPTRNVRACLLVPRVPGVAAESGAEHANDPWRAPARGLQRQGCITSAAVTQHRFPDRQLDGCATRPDIRSPALAGRRRGPPELTSWRTGTARLNCARGSSGARGLHRMDCKALNVDTSGAFSAPAALRCGPRIRTPAGSGVVVAGGPETFS